MAFEITKIWDEITTKTTENISKLLEIIHPISKSRKKRIVQKSNYGFNVFELISDTYYKENFHSQILSKFLSPSYHDEGIQLLETFIKCLNNLCDNRISFNQFQNPIVENEKDNIDIRIRDIQSKKSIIIENKINNAVDQYRQLPKYLANEINAGYDVVAIVYLTLVKGKKPSKLDWTDEERKTINNLLIELPAFSYSNTNLCRDWIDMSIINTKELNVISTLRQYRDIINKLTQKEMDKLIVEKFYSEILNENHFQSAWFSPL